MSKAFILVVYHVNLAQVQSLMKIYIRSFILNSTEHFQLFLHIAIQTEKNLVLDLVQLLPSGGSRVLQTGADNKGEPSIDVRGRHSYHNGGFGAFSIHFATYFICIVAYVVDIYHIFIYCESKICDTKTGACVW